MRLTPTLSTNENFRKSLTPTENRVWNAAHHEMGTNAEKAADLGMTTVAFLVVLDQAKQKFHKLATRQEM